MLTFINDKNRYKKEASRADKETSNLMTALKRLSQKELVGIVDSIVKRYPEIKRELMLKFNVDKTSTLNSVFKQIERAFPSIASRNYSTSHIARDLNRIKASVQTTSDEIRAAVYWDIVDNVLRELNEYGFSDDHLEDVAMEGMDDLVDLLSDNDSLHAVKSEIIKKLMNYYTWHNCG